MSTPFQLAIISDEIAQDFGHACEVARELGCEWIELRELWNKNLFHLEAAELAEARRLLAKYELRVTGIASPLFKVDWPGAPVSAFSPPRDEFGAAFSFERQPEVLERGLELARRFSAPRLRCFDFWRLADATPHRAAINARLRQAAQAAAAAEVTLVLENELACNTATAAEAAAVLAAVPELQLVWDPANAAMAGDRAFPEGYRLLPVHRIGHVHCKNCRPQLDGKLAWSPVSAGVVDWRAQLLALYQDGYRGGVSLETHWRGAGTPEASSRQCFRELEAALPA